ncbi:KOW motif-containing protein [Fodinisporobacter ferrooxydans]|uniref:KOW motif-containing protein n=1 Tax=Fodinisporobacter ferrooxydans TaxID=2901836 RepID=A0ABY4CLH0_9BACL|nr:KOW motif-containing protein [Alicyclobacillaceae bacterium MYW30-H2]
MKNRFFIGENVRVKNGSHAGQKGIVKNADYGFRFGWTYTVQLQNGEKKVFWESDLTMSL